MNGIERHITLRQKLRYWVDNGLARGVLVVAAWLSAAMLVLVVAGALVMWLGGIGPNDQGQSFADDLWMTLTRSLDSGVFGQDEGTRLRLTTLTITIAGLVAVAILIGVVTTSIERRLDRLRRGRSLVVEREHTLILGTSTKLLLVIGELLEARRYQSRPVIVILSSEDKVDVEERIKREVKRSRSARIVVRRGDPAEISDLEMVRPDTARSIIILRPDADDGDAEVVRVAVAVVNELARPDTTVIAELRDSATADALEDALEHKLTTVVPSRTVPPIAAQTLRASGLGRVYQDLLDFEGNEFYLIDPPQIPGSDDSNGRTFGDLLSLPEGCTVVGLEAEKTGQLCPNFDEVLTANHRLIVIAEDLDHALRFSRGRDVVSTTPRMDEQSTGAPLPRASRADITLLIGWNDLGPSVVKEIRSSSKTPSVVHVFADKTWGDIEEPSYASDGVVKDHDSVHRGSTTDADEIRRVIEEKNPNHILVLASHEDKIPSVSDARTLLTLLHVDHALRGEHAIAGIEANVVAEFMLLASVKLAQIANPDDFIVSGHLVSLLMTQYSEYRKRRWILEDLFRSDGPRIELHSMDVYELEDACTFGELTERGRSRGVIILGWHLGRETLEPTRLSSRTVLNPRKSTIVQLTKADRIIAMVRPDRSA